MASLMWIKAHRRRFSVNLPARRGERRMSETIAVFPTPSRRSGGFPSTGRGCGWPPVGVTSRGSGLPAWPIGALTVVAGWLAIRAAAVARPAVSRAAAQRRLLLRRALHGRRPLRDQPPPRDWACRSMARSTLLAWRRNPDQIALMGVLLLLLPPRLDAGRRSCCSPIFEWRTVPSWDRFMDLVWYSSTQPALPRASGVAVGCRAGGRRLRHRCLLDALSARSPRRQPCSRQSPRRSPPCDSTGGRCCCGPG